MTEREAEKTTELPTVTLSPNPRRYIHGDFAPVATGHPEGDGQLYLTIHAQGMDVSFEFEEIEHAEAVVKALADAISDEREARG
jgi:hypothetical protein